MARQDRIREALRQLRAYENDELGDVLEYTYKGKVLVEVKDNGKTVEAAKRNMLPCQATTEAIRNLPG